MTRHYPDLGSASDWLKICFIHSQKIWGVIRHRYGISALVSWTSFRGETSGRDAKGRFFSQAILFGTTTFVMFYYSCSSYSPAF